MRDEATEKAQLFSCNKMVDTLQKYVFGEWINEQDRNINISQSS